MWWDYFAAVPEALYSYPWSQRRLPNVLVLLAQPQNTLTVTSSFLRVSGIKFHQHPTSVQNVMCGSNSDTDGRQPDGLMSEKQNDRCNQRDMDCSSTYECGTPGNDSLCFFRLNMYYSWLLLQTEWVGAIPPLPPSASMACSGTAFNVIHELFRQESLRFQSIARNHRTCILRNFFTPWFSKIYDKINLIWVLLLLNLPKLHNVWCIYKNRCEFITASISYIFHKVKFHLSRRFYGYE
jgi:hypothetical protein